MGLVRRFRLSTELRSCSPILWISRLQSPLPERAVCPASSAPPESEPPETRDVFAERRSGLGEHPQPPPLNFKGVPHEHSRAVRAPNSHHWRAMASPCHH